MSLTTSLYAHTILRFNEGKNSASDTYKVMLLSETANFSTALVTIEQVAGALTDGPGSSRLHEIAGGGWPSGGVTVSASLDTATVGANVFDSRFRLGEIGGVLTDVILGPIRGYVVYNATDTYSPPLALSLIYPGATVTPGNTIAITWPVYGLITWQRPG